MSNADGHIHKNHGVFVPQHPCNIERCVRQQLIQTVVPPHCGTGFGVTIHGPPQTRR